MDHLFYGLYSGPRTHMRHGRTYIIQSGTGFSLALPHAIL